MRIYDEGKKEFTNGDGDECKAVVVDHITGETTTYHVYSSDEPEENDVCACGRFFYRGAINHSET